MIDTHCHLTYEPLSAQLDAVLTRAAAAGVDRMISVGTSPDDSRLAAKLAVDRAGAGVFSSAGLHPGYCDQWTDKPAVVEALRELIARPRVVALGEFGLDHHYPDPPPEVQRRALDWQLEVAATCDKPIIIHNREATADVLAALRGSGIAPGRFVFHCFTGSDAELDAILAFGAMVSFTGIVTFKNAAALGASATRVPLDRLMLETDAPYLTPEPHRKVKVNEPGFVPAVGRFLAAKRGMDAEAFIAAADANAGRFFGLGRGVN